AVVEVEGIVGRLEIKKIS
ncbi:unnamed protein product, partial [Allacma fusca]